MSKEKIIYGIIGNPLTHSLSPVMHNAAFKALEVDAEYQLFPLNEQDLSVFFENLRDKNSPIGGLNVTVPYKEKVLEYMDSLAPLSQKIMAVNTIVISKDRQLVGYNTDAPGFLAHLAELQIETAGKRVAILGAGGSARAIITTLSIIPERPDSIKIYNRTSSRIDNLLMELGQRIDISHIESVNSVDALNIELADILINTTSIGLHEEDLCLVDADHLHSNLFVYDLIYNPAESKLLALAKKKGARTANGLGMLFYQGVLALEHWAETRIEDDVKMIMRHALEKEVAQ